MNLLRIAASRNRVASIVTPPTPPTPGTNPDAQAYADDVVANGGDPLSEAQLQAFSDFCDALDTASISGKMISVMVFWRDLTTAFTPLYQVGGNDPWTNNNFVVGDLSVNGLKGDGSTTYLDSGFTGTDLFTVSNAGLSLMVYEHVSPSGAATEFGGDDFVNYFQLRTAYGADPILADAFCYSGEAESYAPSVSYSPSPITGMFSLNLTSATAFAFYHGTAAGNLTTLGTNATEQTHVSDTNLFSHCYNSQGSASTFTLARISFIALHSGLTLGEAQDLYDAAYALRTALGGGAA